MRRSLTISIAVSLCLLLSLQTAQAAGKIRWLNSLPAALTEARRDNKLIMLDFFTEW